MLGFMVLAAVVLLPEASVNAVSKVTYVTMPLGEDREHGYFFVQKT